MLSWSGPGLSSSDHGGYVMSRSTASVRFGRSSLTSPGPVRTWTLVALALILVAGLMATFVVRELIPHWELSWSDNFSGSTLDTAKWEVENESTFGNGNKELACLMSGPNNVIVANGTLTLQARREVAPIKCGDKDTRFPSGRPYTSAMISTEGKEAWHEGKFEIRARLPLAPGASKGLWPAFWLRPQSGTGDGELDVLEAIGTGPADTGEVGTVHQTLWYDENGTYPKQSTVARYPNDRPATDFHTYAAEWRGGMIRWFIDGRMTYERSMATTPWLKQAFSGDFYLRLNVAVGGTFPGAPTAATQLPAGMVVDWVKVYQWR